MDLKLCPPLFETRSGKIQGRRLPRAGIELSGPCSRNTAGPSRHETSSFKDISIQNTVNNGGYCVKFYLGDRQRSNCGN